MTELVVMKKGFASMNVPHAKLQEYLDDGWEEVERIEMTSDAQAKKSSAKKQDVTKADLSASPRQAEKKAKAEDKRQPKDKAEPKAEPPASE